MPRLLLARQGSRLTANGQMFAMMKAHQGGRLLVKSRGRTK